MNRYQHTTNQTNRKDVDPSMKLITIDLDGTLLNNEGRVSPYTAEVISEVRRAGHKIVIATGRHAATALPIAEELGLTDAIICFNGALVMNLENKEIKKAHAYMNHDVYHFTRLAKDWGYSYFTATQHRYHVEDRYGHLITDFVKNGIDVDEVQNIDEVKDPIFKMTVVGLVRELDQVERFIHPTVSGLQVIRSAETAIDVVSPEASKGNALAWLTHDYHVDWKDTIAFGNYDNDVSMLRFARTGIAMENAPDHVKEQADMVCHSNEEDGVARFLEANILQKVTV